MARVRWIGVLRLFGEGVKKILAGWRDISKTVGTYCWPTSFKVLGVLFLGEVCSAFLPSKKAYWARQFRYLGVGQQ